MNADYGETFCLSDFTTCEPLASCMSSPSAQGPPPHTLDLGDAPNRMFPISSHAVHLRSAAVGAPMAFLLGVTRPFQANSNSSQGHAVTAGIASGSHDFSSTLHAHHAPYTSGPQGLAPSRPPFTMTTAHLHLPVQRISESSSAASGSDSPFAYQVLNGSTLVPPGDEHTDALLRSLMSLPTKPPVLPPGGAPGTSTVAGSRGPPIAPLFRDDDGGSNAPRPYTAAAAAAAPPHVALNLARPAAAASSLSAAAASLPDAHLAALLLDPRDLRLLQSGGGLPRAALNSEFSLGLLPTDPLLSARDAAILEEAAFGPRQRATALVPPLPAGLQLHTADPPLPVRHNQHQQQHQHQHQQQLAPLAAVGRPGAVQRAPRSWERGENPPPAPPPPPPPPPPPVSPLSLLEVQLKGEVGDEPMSEARAAGRLADPATPATAAAAVAMAGVQHAAASMEAERDERALPQPANQGGDTHGSARLRRRINGAGRAAEVECGPASSVGLLAYKEACNSSAGVEGGAAGSEGARTRSAPAGSLARLSSGDALMQSAERAEAAPAYVRSGSVGLEEEEEEEEGDEDERPVTRDHDTSDESDGDGGGDDGSARMQLVSRKRTASQRRRGSAAAKKELSRERNRTAQRRFRERQKDLIKALQDQVERQENLILELQNRLAVFEDRPPLAPAEQSKSGGEGDDNGGGDDKI
ncbi:hypothetical protein PLESTB_001074100 [Pleodorina starrii]|uniref:BZIP domain-containing protein n=1 Tax=Pleodorina starrii TaxID=330485 RepID=A0A9W6BRE4_9CHLO|nr:hypothetical protein PLESTB_001074100 [Pleodorina starrii]GLC74964.1 hypothetical protein PLESTF_001577700 [Pleodorina starrii]